MRWPIRNQILLPFATVLLVAVGTTALTASWLAVCRSEQQTVSRLRSVVRTLESATFPFSQNVLQQVRGLTDAHFAVLDRRGTVLAATLPLSGTAQQLVWSVPVARDLDSLLDYPLVSIGGDPYFAVRLRAERPGDAAWLVVLYPVRSWHEDRWNAAWPPLAIGAVTLLVMAAVSGLLAARLGRRIRRVQQVLAQIAAGRFVRAPVTTPRDELSDLLVSANRLSDRLEQMQETIRQTEQLRVLAQVAGGLAHQLRNDIAGARMALELHRKRCGTSKGEESLQVALRQLVLTEDHVRSFLAFARRDQPSQQAAGELSGLLRDLESLLRPMCEHTGVQLELTVDLPNGSAEVLQADSVRVAVMNLMLNAIEAAGPGGRVWVRARGDGRSVCVEVVDTGPGPPEEIRAKLFEPFVTSKPEGVGLGLAIARRVASELDGELTWTRQHDQTVFTLRWPARRPVDTRGGPDGPASEVAENGHEDETHTSERAPSEDVPGAKTGTNLATDR